jgi:hypothetical protein
VGHLVVYHPTGLPRQRALEREAAEKNNILANIIVFSGGLHCDIVRNPVSAAPGIDPATPNRCRPSINAISTHFLLDSSGLHRGPLLRRLPGGGDAFDLPNLRRVTR